MISISCIQNVLLWTALLGSTSIDSAAPSVQTTTYPLLLADLPLLLLGNEGRTGHQCTTVLAARAGARFDPRHGGSAARAALLATCLLISDRQYPGATIFAHPEVGGDDALIFIHHRPEDLVRLLHRLRRVLDGSDAYEECQWAIERLLNNRREYANPCSCVSACCCGPRHQIRQRLVEAVDPLPWGSRRSGCSRRLEKLTGSEVDQWRREHLRTGRVALTIDTLVDLHRFVLRADVAMKVRKALADLPSTSPAETVPLKTSTRFLEPVKTIISPPIIEPGQPQRVIAGWLADELTPSGSIPLLEPRVEIWDVMLLPGETPRRCFLRLQARRRAARIGPIHFQNNHRQPDHAELALLMLRRNDPPPNSSLPRRARRSPIVTLLRHEAWP